jgi:membrane protease YdiL (CAAX protease family)
VRNNYIHLFISSAALTGSAVFDYSYRFHLLTALMLFLPLFDPAWSMPRSPSYEYKHLIRILLFLLIVLVASNNTDNLEMALSVLVFTALPEEWFFRAYFMSRIEILLSRKAASSDLKGTDLNVSGNGNKSQATSWLSNPLLKPENSANLAASIFFSILHLPTQGIVGLSVLIPALVFGKLYQKSRDLVLVVLLHALSNIVFYMFIRRSLVTH